MGNGLLLNWNGFSDVQRNAYILAGETASGVKLSIPRFINFAVSFGVASPSKFAI